MPGGHSQLGSNPRALPGRWLLGAGKRVLRSRVGIWRLFEYRNVLRHGWATRTLHKVEDEEVSGLAARIGMLGPAKVATIIPTYRRPQLLICAVESALQQTESDQVIVVVDDGGGLPAGLPQDDRLITLALRENTGVLGVVRNVGIRLTSSTYIAFLDDDNTWEPTHLETALAVLDSTANKTPPRLVYTAIRRLRSDGTQMDILSQPFDRRRLADESFIDANSIVVRRDPGVVFSRMPRGLSTLPKEDWELVFRLSRTRRTVHIPIPTVRYLVNEQSYYSDWSAQPAPRHLTDEDRGDSPS